VGSSICLASSVGCAEGAGGSPCRPVVEMDLLPSRRLRLSNSCPSFPVGRMAGTWEEGHTPVRVWYERGVCVVLLCFIRTDAEGIQGTEGFPRGHRTQTVFAYFRRRLRRALLFLTDR